MTTDSGSTIKAPIGCASVEHDDGRIHVIDYDAWPEGVALWRVTPACGTATGVSSDEGGPYALRRRFITCPDCVAILAPPAGADSGKTFTEDDRGNWSEVANPPRYR